MINNFLLLNIELLSQLIFILVIRENKMRLFERILNKFFDNTKNVISLNTKTIYVTLL